MPLSDSFTATVSQHQKIELRVEFILFTLIARSSIFSSGSLNTFFLSFFFEHVKFTEYRAAYEWVRPFACAQL